MVFWQSNCTRMQQLTEYVSKDSVTNETGRVLQPAFTPCFLHCPALTAVTVLIHLTWTTQIFSNRNLLHWSARIWCFQGSFGRFRAWEIEIHASVPRFVGSAAKHSILFLPLNGRMSCQSYHSFEIPSQSYHSHSYHSWELMVSRTSFRNRFYNKKNHKTFEKCPKFSAARLNSTKTSYWFWAVL